MKKLLIPTLFVMLAACSGEKSSEQNTGRIKFAHISASASASDVSLAGRKPCSAALDTKERCAAVLLKKGAKPKFPLTDTKDVMMVFIYDPATVAGVGFDFRYNCDIVKKDTDLCLADVAEANRMLEPFLQ